MLCKKGVLKNFAKFTGKHLCQSLFFNKVAGLRPVKFPVNFAKFLRPFFMEHLWWVLVKFISNAVLNCKKYFPSFSYFATSEKRGKYLRILHETTCDNYFHHEMVVEIKYSKAYLSY